MTIDQLVSKAIEGVTGHRAEDLEASMALDMDLGIDSIKMVELLSLLIKGLEVPPGVDPAAALSPERMLGVVTIADLITAVKGLQDRLSGNPPIEDDAASGQPAPPDQGAGETVDILAAQYAFLVSHWTTSTCSLVSAVRLGGELKVDLLQQAAQALVDRNPVLRARFAIPDHATGFDAYRLEVAPVATLGPLPVTEISARSTDDQESVLDEQAVQGVNQVWQLDHWPLFRFSLFILGPDDHVLLLVNHHLISDGLGNQMILRGILALYAALDSNQAAALPAPLSVAEYQRLVAGINAWRDQTRIAALTQAARAQGRSKPFFWDPLRRGRPGHAVADNRHHRMRVDAGTVEALVGLTRGWRLPMNVLLIGAYVRTLAQLDPDQRSLIVNIPTSGRLYPEADAMAVIGCFAQNLSVTVSAPGTASWRDQLAAIDQTVQQALGAEQDRAQAVVTAEACRALTLEQGRVVEPTASLIRANLKTNVYMPYVGQTHIAPRYGPLRVIDYFAVTSTNAGAVDTLIEQHQGCLHVTVNYDGAAYSADLIARFAALFHSHLKALAAQSASIATDAHDPIATAARSAAPTETDRQVLEVAASVLGRPLDAAAIGRDLEADLGLDSLDRIRIVTHLRKRLGTGVDPEALLAARTLHEIAGLLQGADAARTEPPAGQAGGRPGARNTTVAAPDAAALDTWMRDPVPYLKIIAQCRATPKATAVLDGDGNSVTYHALGQRSNRLAHSLRGIGVGPGARVGVYLHRTAHLLVAVLGIVKTGAAYVPLEPDYPINRLTYMLSHAEIRVLVTEEALGANVGKMVPEGTALQAVVFMDVNTAPALQLPAAQLLCRSDLSTQPGHDLPRLSDPDDLMVVLYTSGSTGKPKGVALAHRGYTNRFKWHQRLFPVGPGDRVGEKTSICFDISVWELFWPLMVGACVCPVRAETVRNPWKLADWMERYEINIMHFVPSLFGEFLSAVDLEQREFRGLRWLIFSGEALPAPFIRSWFDRVGRHVGLANLYGPTEASIDVTAHIIEDRPDQERIPIGRAMDEVFLELLDDEMRPVPPGTQGQLWIGGIQLAHGYLNAPEITAAAFRPNPFPERIPGRHLYQTGDLCVLLEDGTIDYRGRVDSQIKIRGYRVELGEIEAALLAQPAVREAAALAIEHEGKTRLVAWLAGVRVEDRTLRTALAKRLPDYMLPHRFAWLDALPKTPNGKLDRNRLKQSFTADAPVPPDDVALGPAQLWLVRFFAPPHLWTGFSRFHYAGPLDLQRLEQVYRHLVTRHDALRAVCFQRPDGTWRQRFVDPDDAWKMEVLDARSWSADQRRSEITSWMDETCRAFRVGQAPLWRILVVQGDDEDFEIVTVGHHIISDLLGNGVLFRECWALYDAAHDQTPFGQSPALSRGDASFRDYLELCEQLKRTDGDAYLTYWRSQFPSREYRFQVPLDHWRGENTESSAAVETFALSREETSALHRARRVQNCSFYTLLLAALYQTMGEWGGQNRVVLSHRTHGRDLGDGRSFFSVVGNLAINHPIAVTLGSSWGEMVRAIARAFADCPLNGVSYDLVGDRLPAWCYPDNALTPVRINFLGNRSQRQTGPVRFEADAFDQRYSMPEQERISLIEVVIAIVDGVLEVSWHHSRHFHSPETIRRQGERTLALLRRLVDAETRPETPINPPEGAPEGAPAPVPEPVAAAPSAAPLAGTRALVTGASGGLGRAIVQALAGRGARVALLARSRAPLEAVLATLQTRRSDALLLEADVSVLCEVEDAVATIDRQWGGVDLLVNGAGLAWVSPLAGSDPAQWRDVMEVNLFGAYHACRSVLPGMIARKSGKIVNLCSDAGERGYPLLSAYAASKHALLGLTRSLAEELRGDGIQVNAVCPAVVSDVAGAGADGHGVTPEEIAAAVAYLASAEADAMTGQQLNLFGQRDDPWQREQVWAAISARIGRR